MTNSPSNFLGALLNILQSLLKRPTRTSQPVPSKPADNTTEPARIVTSRVLLVVYDPIMDPATGQKLSQKMHWGNPYTLSNEFIADILALSNGLARYEIVDRMELNEFPALADNNFRYDPATYMAVINKTAAPHKPDPVNYNAILTGLNILPRVANREIDEVWIFNFPYAGFAESIMGGAGAFWCNSKPLANTSACSRKFVVMGFNFERGVGEMLEAFCHRAESMLAQEFNCQNFVAWAYQKNRVPATVGANLNLFQRFLCFEQIAPGQSGVGTVHYAPNSDTDYEWNNPRLVMSSCYDWYNFPVFTNDIRQVSADEWGRGNLRAHHGWWLKHIPHIAGRTSGVANNWWQYIMDANLINL